MIDISESQIRVNISGTLLEGNSHQKQVATAEISLYLSVYFSIIDFLDLKLSPYFLPLFSRQD